MMIGASREPSTNLDRAPSLNGRRFTAVATDGTGDVDASTVFEYHEEHGVIWAQYGGGPVLRGYLVGTRAGDEWDCRAWG
jgi:hypothetical protein